MSDNTESINGLIVANAEKKYFLPDYIPVPPLINGSCKGLPTEWWFPAFQANHEQRKKHEHAIEICKKCPEQKECLAFALEHSTLQGIWGGTYWRERRRMRVSLGSKPGIPFVKTRSDKNI